MCSCSRRALWRASMLARASFASSLRLAQPISNSTEMPGFRLLISTTCSFFSSTKEGVRTRRFKRCDQSFPSVEITLHTGGWRPPCPPPTSAAPAPCAAPLTAAQVSNVCQRCNAHAECSFLYSLYTLQLPVDMYTVQLHFTQSLCAALCAMRNYFRTCHDLSFQMSASSTLISDIVVWVTCRGAAWTRPHLRLHAGQAGAIGLQAICDGVLAAGSGQGQSVLLRHGSRVGARGRVRIRVRVRVEVDPHPDFQ